MTPREERRLGLRSDPLGIGLAVLAALLAWGCSDSRGQPEGNAGAGYAEPGTPAPRAWTTTPEGVRLGYPAWLDHPQHAAQRAAMLDEVRTVVPEADPRIDPALRGVPAGVTLIVLDPGAYHAPYSPTLLASGEWRAPSTIYVAWRGASTGPVLPALAHELRHLLTRDPQAGH